MQCYLAAEIHINYMPINNRTPIFVPLSLLIMVQHATSISPNKNQGAYLGLFHLLHTLSEAKRGPFALWKGCSSCLPSQAHLKQLQTVGTGCPSSLPNSSKLTGELPITHTGTTESNPDANITSSMQYHSVSGSHSSQGDHSSPRHDSKSLPIPNCSEHSSYAISWCLLHASQAQPHWAWSYSPDTAPLLWDR